LSAWFLIKLTGVVNTQPLREWVGVGGGGFRGKLAAVNRYPKSVLPFLSPDTKKYVKIYFITRNT
jgi:hypothetical protein